MKKEKKNVKGKPMNRINAGSFLVITYNMALKMTIPKAIVLLCLILNLVKEIMKKYDQNDQND